MVVPAVELPAGNKQRSHKARRLTSGERPAFDAHARTRTNQESCSQGLGLVRKRILPLDLSQSMPSRRKAGMSADIKIYNVRELGRPLGPYSQVARVKASEFLFIAGMVATDASGNVVGEGDFVAQCKQTFANIETALRSANAGWGNVVQFTTYLVHSQDIAQFMNFRRREFPAMFENGAYPPNTLLMIDRLVKEAFLIEVQAVAAL
jgi:enamine deaminase RidA (YjgF/YER057c/UK114 family)